MSQKGKQRAGDLKASYTFPHKKEMPLTSGHGASRKPIVIGIYGIPGSGKSFLWNQLRNELPGNEYQFYEGAEVISSVTPGGLKKFKGMNVLEMTSMRERAIDAIRDESAKLGRTAIVTGHFMFWAEGDEEGTQVYTRNDLSTYTHILYMDVPGSIIEQRRWNDKSKPRPFTSDHHLLKWQEAEKAQLKTLCSDRGILFSVLKSDETAKSRALTLIRDSCLHTEEYNEARALAKVDEAISKYTSAPDTMLVIDGDRTLAEEDTSVLFWQEIFRRKLVPEMNPFDTPLRNLFSGPMKYSYQAFRQAVLLYEDAVDDQTYESICQEVAAKVQIYPEFKALLGLVAKQENIGAIVVSCGLRRVWEHILDNEGLSEHVPVIAGGRVSDGFVVTPETKAAVVSRLQFLHSSYVWAFGDSPIDLPMLAQADEAIVAVGDEENRSRSMETSLSDAIDNGLSARQVLFPSSTYPRLSTISLPLIDINNIEFLTALLSRHDRSGRFVIHHATSRHAAKIISTRMRDAAIAGPALRKAHHEAGWYLSVEFVSQILGVEGCPISHVLGHKAKGFRLLNEAKTTIVAIMRAGEPMASGVSDAFPLAMYMHAKHPSDLTADHVQDCRQVVLVDSVINSGKTIIEFVERVRELGSKTRIVVVAGVVQGECVSSKSKVYKALDACGDVSLVTLRISTTKFTGSGVTDTGNRLFNTTHIA